MTTDTDPSLAMQLRGIRHARLGELEAAIALLRQAATQWPEDARAHHNLATALAMSNQNLEAMESLSRSLDLEPRNAVAFCDVASLMRRSGQPAAALAACERALALRPEDPAALQMHGELLHELSRVGLADREEARASLEAALANGGNEAELRYAMAALGAGAPPPMMPRVAVIELFDQNADAFDQRLVGDLKYRGPEVLREALQAVGATAGIDVIDLGCGTGLSGVPLRPLARTLVGVDLSEGMLAKARARGCYDTLECADVVEHLQSLHGAADLAVGVELLLYIGDIEPLATALRQALRPGGRFAFTIESMPDDSTADYAVLPSHRYGQSEAYLRRTAAAHGFAIEHDQPVVLRLEGGADVAGRVQVWRAPA